MAKPITVYYAYNDMWQEPIPPQPVYANAVKDEFLSKFNDREHAYALRCPAMSGFYKNTFAVHSPFDYTLQFDNGQVRSHDWDQDFFDSAVLIRNSHDRFVTINFGNILFVPDCESLEVAQMPPIWSPSHANNAVYMVGQFDTAKHIREFELAIALRKDGEINFVYDQPMYYLKFLTDANIQFKRFVRTKTFNNVVDGILYTRNYTKRIFPLSHWYERVRQSNIKKQLLKIAKENAI